ncbi:FKBP-type peptidyl-prolyl cis-trans isomerase [Luteimonas sp. FXH3W]|uniref:Peptidyl-prolyl cis-trans isomerase n=1 Tax=Aquilutibacter rugosus TaxID=3115820 RepID=A0ABU7UZZ6_9GAMM
MRSPLCSAVGLVTLATLFAATPVPAQTSAAKAASATATTKSSNSMHSYAVGQNIAAKLGHLGTFVNGDTLVKLLGEHLDGKAPRIDAVRGEQIFMQIADKPEIKTLPAGITPDDVAAVAAGYLIGPSLNAVKNDVSLDDVYRGVRTTLAGKPELSDAKLREQLSQFAALMQQRSAERNAKAAETNKAEGTAFLTKNKAVAGVKVTASGLQYIALREGNGPRPTPSQKVRVHYEGRLINGTVFDSSYKRNDPAEFRLDQVIKGWTEGLGLMPVGSKYRLFIPSDLAYGATPRPGGPIGPNATLIFDVELLNIVPN